MKINDNDQISKNFHPETRINPPKPSDKTFGSILKERLAKSKPAVSNTRPATYAGPMNGIQLRTPVLPGFDQQFAMDRIDNLLGLLEQYRQQLIDPATTLRNIDPIVQQIHQESESLTPVLDDMPEGEELKNILNETLVTASLEVTKFYRGDYIAR